MANDAGRKGETPGMDFGFSEEQNILRDSVRKLMDKHAPPEYVRKLDREQAYPYELYDAWVKAGLISLPFPEEDGGHGGTVLGMTLAAEQIARRSTDPGVPYPRQAVTD